MTQPAPVATRRRGRLGMVAQKVVMALTGAVFALFVLAHMLGNLKVYGDPEGFNRYAHWLRDAFEPLLPHEGLLWMLRLVLLACLVLHLWCGWSVRRHARLARGPHRRRGTATAAWAARSMPATGLVLLGFLVFHLLDLTTGTAPVAPAGFQPAGAQGSHAHANLVASLRRWPVALVYAATMVALCAHLAQGLRSVVLDLGATPGARGWRLLTLAGLALALLVCLGNLSIPLAVQAGVVR